MTTALTEAEWWFLAALLRYPNVYRCIIDVPAVPMLLGPMPQNLLSDTHCRVLELGPQYGGGGLQSTHQHRTGGTRLLILHSFVPLLHMPWLVETVPHVLVVVDFATRPHPPCSTDVNRVFERWTRPTTPPHRRRRKVLQKKYPCTAFWFVW